MSKQDKEKHGNRNTGSFACEWCNAHQAYSGAVSTASTRMRCAPFLGRRKADCVSRWGCHMSSTVHKQLLVELTKNGCTHENHLYCIMLPPSIMSGACQGAAALKLSVGLFAGMVLLILHQLNHCSLRPPFQLGKLWLNISSQIPVWLLWRNT